MLYISEDSEGSAIDEFCEGPTYSSIFIFLFTRDPSCNIVLLIW